MSNPPSVLPPNPYFPGIIYNPTDYLSISGSTVLTYAQASVLFIQKTISDTVTGITNFVNGITTSSILAKTISATCSLWTNSTAEIFIGTLGGRSALIHIGDGNSNLAGSGVHINNGTNTASNVQILNGIGSTGTINLGSSTSVTNCNCPLTLNYAPSALTGTNNLGYKSPATAGSTSLLAGTATNVSQVTLTAGIWMATGNVFFVTPGALMEVSIYNGVGIDTNNYTAVTGVNGGCIQVSRIINTNIDGTGNWYLVAKCSTGSTIGSVRYNVYRIA